MNLKYFYVKILETAFEQKDTNATGAKCIMHNSRHWHYLERRGTMASHVHIVSQVHIINYSINWNAFSFYKPTSFRFNRWSHKKRTKKPLEHFSEMQSSQLEYFACFVHISKHRIYCDSDSSHSRRNKNWNFGLCEFILHEYRINSNASLSDLCLSFFSLLFSTSRGTFFVVVWKKDADQHRCHSATIYEYHGIWFG